MKLTTEEMRTLYQQQTSRSWAGRADCLAEELMMRAAAGELSQLDREMTADHLMVCSDCAEEYRLLRELKPWADQAADSPQMPGAVTKPIRGADRDDRARLPQPGWIKRLTGIFSPGIAPYTMAAVFLVISLVSVAWVISLRRENARMTAQLNERKAASTRDSDSLAETRRQLEETTQQVEKGEKEIAQLRRSVDELSQPQVNVPVTDLAMDEARSEPSEVTTVTVPAGTNLFTLLLHGERELSFPDYALEVIDDRGQLVHRVSGLRKNEADSFNVALPRRKLPAGRYRLRLYGLRAGKSERVGDYLMRVRYQ